jgi:hypothetical protein
MDVQVEKTFIKSLDEKTFIKSLDEKTFIKSLDEKTFIKSLDEKELMAYNIAKSHLGTMFSLDKSNAYLEWKAKANP